MRQVKHRSQIPRNGGGYNRHSPQGQKGQTMTNKTTFTDCVNRYNANPHDEQALTDMATAVTYAVLKKIINTTNNPTLETVRKELSRDIANIDRLRYANDNATRITYTADGDINTEIVDGSLADATTKLIGQTIGDGLDLMHDAIAAVLDETAKQTEREPGQPTDLERPYTVRRLKRKVYIRTEDSVGAWETVETTPIQEIYKAVRRSVNDSRAMQTDPRNGYSYIADIVADSDSAETATVYRRLPKYADLGGHVCDYNGKETIPTTADTQTVMDIDAIVAALNLTDRESTVLKYRIAGYGYKSISVAMGITIDNAKRCGHRIREKSTTIGFTPEMWREMTGDGIDI